MGDEDTTPESSDGGGARSQPAIERALETMRGRLADSLPLHDLAHGVHLSTFHFARTFRRATGVSPGAFLAAVRLDEAKRLLLTTNLPVTEICFAVGYRSLGSFTARFTRLVGLPPTHLRHLPDRLAKVDLSRPEPRLVRVQQIAQRGYLVGRVEAPDLGDVPIAVGLYPSAIPQGYPVVDLLLPAPGPFALPLPPDGSYHLMAATLAGAGDPVALLLPGSAQWVGRSARPLRVHGGRATGPSVVRLHPAQPLDPPILTALPALLLAPRAPHHLNP